MEKTLPRRNDVPQADRWAVETVFPSEEVFEDVYAQAEARIAPLADLSGTLGGSGGWLLAALEARQAVEVEVSRIRLYAMMQSSGDETNGANGARRERAGALTTRFEAAVAYVEPEILAIPTDTLERFLSEEPRLAPFRHYLDGVVRMRDHVRSAEVESLLAQAGDALASSWHTHEALENADLRFATITDEDGSAVELAQGNSDRLIESAHRPVRRAAWEAYADGYLSVKNTLAATLAGAVKRDVFDARAHGYASAREASLYPYNLPPAVFDTLIATVRDHLPLWRRYWDIRRRALGVAELHPYDLRVPLAVTEDPIPFDQGVELLLEGLAPLGDEYVTVACRGLTEERWCDRYPNIGKSSGAHSTGVYGSHPFLMQNYQDSLLDVSTLAHELGHSMHSWYTWRNQPPIYGWYSMFVAETASNFNQALLRGHLLRKTDDRRFQVAVIEEGMANFYRYFFVMPILAQFEQTMHEQVERGQGLTADGMSARIVELIGEGYGGRVAMDEARVGVTWAQFGHLYMDFYVWQYATGISAANALAAAVLEEGAPAAARYLDCLKAGGSLYPIDALRLAGIDMTTREPIERAFGVLEGLVDRLDTLVGDGPLPWLPQ